MPPIFLSCSLVYPPIFFRSSVIGLAFVTIELVTIDPRDPCPKTQLVDYENQSYESEQRDRAVYRGMDQPLYHLNVLTIPQHPMAAV